MEPTTAFISFTFHTQHSFTFNHEMVFNSFHAMMNTDQNDDDDAAAAKNSSTVSFCHFFKILLLTTFNFNFTSVCAIKWNQRQHLFN